MPSGARRRSRREHWRFRDDRPRGDEGRGVRWLRRRRKNHDFQCQTPRRKLHSSNLPSECAEESRGTGKTEPFPRPLLLMEQPEARIDDHLVPHDSRISRLRPARPAQEKHLQDQLVAAMKVKLSEITPSAETLLL